MDNADNPPRKPPARPFFAPRSPAKTPSSPASPPGRPAARPFTSRATPSGNPVPAAGSRGAAAPPGEDPGTVARPDELIVNKTDAAVRQGGAQLGEFTEVGMPQAEHAPLDVGSPTPESPPWRPSDRFDAVTDTMLEPVVEAPSQDTRSEATGIVDIMDWMPVPVSDADSSEGENVSDSPSAASVAEIAAEEIAVSTETGDVATDWSADSVSAAEAGADLGSQESINTLDTHHSMPTMATPAFDALTVASGGDPSALLSPEKVEPAAADSADADPGDVWKWGEPSTPAIGGNAIAVTNDSPSVREVEAPQATMDDTNSQSAEIRPREVETTESLEQVKESEPWTTSTAKPHEHRGHAIGDALERVAKRIREGTIVLPADTSASNDEAALALALAALLRGRSD